MIDGSQFKKMPESIRPTFCLKFVDSRRRLPMDAVEHEKRIGMCRVLKIAAVLSCLFLFQQVAITRNESGDVPLNTQTMRYVVQSGETEWEIAERFDSKVDPRAVCDWIEKHNQIGQALQPGQVLVIPRGGSE